MSRDFKILLVGVLLLVVWHAATVAPEIARPRAWATKTAGAGKQIWLGLYNANIESLQARHREVWPAQSDGYRTSTEYFARSFREKWLENFTPMDFGGPGLPQPSSTNFAEFTSANNAWCVTLNCGEGTPPETPFLFTRNFCQTPNSQRGQVSTYGKSLRDISTLCPRTKPFGSRVGVLITWGGSCKVLSAKAIKANGLQHLFNPRDSERPFLRP